MKELQLLITKMDSLIDMLIGRNISPAGGKLKTIIYDGRALQANQDVQMVDEGGLFNGVVQNTGSSSVEIVLSLWGGGTSEKVLYPSGGRARFTNFPLRAVKLLQAGTVSVYGASYTPRTEQEYASKVATGSIDTSGLFSIASGATPVNVVATVDVNLTTESIAAIQTTAAVTNIIILALAAGSTSLSGIVVPAGKTWYITDWWVGGDEGEAAPEPGTYTLRVAGSNYSQLGGAASVSKHVSFNVPVKATAGQTVAVKFRNTGAAAADYGGGFRYFQV